MRLTVKKLTFSEFLIFTAVILLLIINIIAKKFPFLAYFDELLGGVFLILLFVHLNRWKSNKNASKIVLLLLLIVIAGIIYNIAFGINTNISAIFIDAFGVIKNHITFIGLALCLIKVRMERIVKSLIPLMKLYVLVISICGILNFFFNIGMNYSYNRFGLRSYEFLFTNPAMVGITLIVCIAFFEYVHYKGFIKYIALIPMLLTFRSIVYATVAIYIILLLVSKYRSRLKWYHIISIGLVGGLVAWNMVGEIYIKNTESNRYLLIYYGIVLFKRYFPFGTGFGTYGSQMAYTYYSPFYTEFGFTSHWGLNQAYGGTANDNFWPMIIAQFGLLGLICMPIILFNEFKIVSGNADDKGFRVGAFALFFSLLLSTFASADLTGVAGTIRYFALGILVAANLQRSRSSMENIRDEEIISN